MSWFERNEPPTINYCEVIRIGIENDTTEVVVKYFTANRVFEVESGYLLEDTNVGNRDTRYRRLQVVTSKENVVEIRRFKGGKYHIVPANGRRFYYEGWKVTV